MEISDGMTELMEDNAPILTSNSRPLADPPKIHGSLRPGNSQCAFANVGPRPIVILERNTDDGVATIWDELELEIGDGLPPLDHLLDFGLLDRGARRGGDKADSQGLTIPQKMKAKNVSIGHSDRNDVDNIPFRSPTRAMP